ncbi:hypothetical protein EAT51_04330 [Pseudoxanthomonas winnipegensis]|uniref:hypothetical protein n=1 Tax=Pseudoxanthomonas winnipegensis TaxID=2480810 RepID=UPI00102D6D70|nr:hypothetical protein [Pseudoxanthomonas winnipegensis]TAA42932.1 hypothetical protein EAT51_04330 [Pseudoxanthomonas winnipegensis]
MAWTKISSTDSGAPQALSVNGSLNSILRYALNILGWATEYGTTGNASVFRAAAGNRLRLHVRHDSSVSGDPALAYVRGAHTATSATAIGSPFPTATQVPNANSNWRCGVPGDATTAVPWVIYGNDRFFYLMMWDPNYKWDIFYFGDLPSDYATGYETVVCVRNSNSPYGSPSMGASGYAYPAYDYCNYWARGINATSISMMGSRQFSSAGSAMGRIPSTPVMRGGYQNRLMREKVAMSDFGSGTTTYGVLSINRRGWLPNLWNPIHNDIGGSVVDQDTFTDTVYNASAIFRIYDSSVGLLIMEETDTWVKP